MKGPTFHVYKLGGIGGHRWLALDHFGFRSAVARTWREAYDHAYKASR
jgi:hypothetical protein